MKKSEQQILILVALFVGVGLVSGCATETDYQQETSVGDEEQRETGSSTSQKVKILNYEDEVGEFGNMQVVGTAKNVADQRLNYVEIKVKFYNKDKVLLESFMDNTNDLSPGEKWRFKVMYPGMNAEEVEYYKVGVGSVF